MKQVIGDILHDNPIDILYRKSKTEVIYEDDVSIAETPVELAIDLTMFRVFKVFNNLPILSKYSITNHYTNGVFVGKTINKALSEILVDYIDTELKVRYDFISEIEMFHRHVFDIFNFIYNEIGYRISDYAIGINLQDLLALQNDSDMVLAMDTVKKDPSVKNINNTYNTLDYIIRNKPEFTDNHVALSYINGTLKSQQLKQTLGARGFAIEIDSSIFPTPITNSYLEGLNDLHSFGIESRAAANALFHSTVSIADSEYFGRKLQLVTHVIESIDYSDCGNIDYIEWTLSPSGVTQFGDHYIGDLPMMVGKQYKLNPEDNWSTLKGDETELLDKKILIRSVKDCRLSNRRHICSACIGRLSYAIPKHTNLGILAAISLTAPASQKVLSTKHHINSAGDVSVNLDEVGKRYFEVKRGNLIMRKEFKGKNKEVFLIVKEDEFHGLKDLKNASSISSVDPKRVSHIESLKIRTVIDGKVVNEDYVQVRSGNSFGVFTPVFIQYIMSTGFILEHDRARYVIPIDKWTRRSPVITLPNSVFDFTSFNKNLESIITSKKRIDKTGNTISYEAMLSELFTFCNSKLNVNIALLEIILYGFTINDYVNDDYRLARGSKNSIMGGIGDVIKNRSVSTIMGYEELTSGFLDPITTKPEFKESSMFDILIDPVAYLG